jgi:uncharacterized membrane protein
MQQRAATTARARSLSRAPGLSPWLIAPLVIVVLMAPMAFTGRTFATDWTNHVWTIDRMRANIATLGHPSYFLESTLGALYPMFAFYNGTLYAVLGFVALVIGPVGAMVAAFTTAFAMAWVGWVWLARQVGLRGWSSQLPALIGVTCPYFISAGYGRGDLPEFFATSAIPFVAAAALDLVRSPSVRFRVAAAFTAGVVILTGTHTLTLVWGTVFLAIVAAVLGIAYRDFVRARTRRVGALAGLTALGVTINAWFIVPLALYYGYIQEGPPDAIKQTVYTEPAHLLRALPETTPLTTVTGDIDARLPMLALVWTIVVALIVWGALPRQRRALLIMFAALLGATIALVTAPSLISYLPRQLRYLQFPYRIVTYADLAIGGALLVVFAAVSRNRSRRPATAALTAVALVSAGLATYQVWNIRSFTPKRALAVDAGNKAPPSWYSPNQWADRRAPVVQPTLPQPVTIPVEQLGPRHGYSVVYPAGPGGTAATNVATGSYLVRVGGARAVGRTPDGYMVVGLSPSPEARRLTFQPRIAAAVRAGQILTLLAVAGSLTAVAVVVLHRLRRR